MVGQARQARHGARNSRALASTFLELHAELGLRASLDEQFPSDKLGGIPQKNSREDYCTSHLHFASARANRVRL